MFTLKRCLFVSLCISVVAALPRETGHTHKQNLNVVSDNSINLAPASASADRYHRVSQETFSI